MDSPEASVTSLWERLTGSPWWKTVLIVIILIVLYLLFAPCICNCIMGFISNHLKAFSLQMVVQIPTSVTGSSNHCLGPLDQILNMRVRRICCLKNLGPMPLNSRKLLSNENNAPFPWQHNSPKRKGGN